MENKTLPAPLYQVVGRIRIYPESCCEECGETIHNHFDCPACGLAYAPSDQYCALHEEDPPVRISCEKCGAVFQLISGDTWDGEWARCLPPNTGMDRSGAVEPGVA